MNSMSAFAVAGGKENSVGDMKKQAFEFVLNCWSVTLEDDQHCNRRFSGFFPAAS
jgi:hypothetical protein